MANPEHLKILKQGVEQWNRWREEHPFYVPELSEADLQNVRLSGADLRGANLLRANLTGAVLEKANLFRVNLHHANLRGADLREANLGAASLRRTNLREVNLSGASLDRADLSGADLQWAYLSGASLSGSNLNQADLNWANFSAANLSSAQLSEANLDFAILTSADLRGANFNQAIANGTYFVRVDLSLAEGLETLVHRAPSTIGIDTIYKSRGKIPEAFLRGCGVPDEFIAYIGSMVGRPLEFYSCFISYSTKDQEFAERLHADLQAKGVRCWFAPHDLKGGEKLDEQIDKAISLHDKLLLILSEHSMSSNWVKTEIANAREREKREGKQLLFPITLVPFEAIKRWKLFDADIGIDSAREIREYFIPDFSNWKDHDSYQTAFQRLVKDLKAGAGG